MLAERDAKTGVGIQIADVGTFWRWSFVILTRGSWRKVGWKGVETDGCSGAVVWYLVVVVSVFFGSYWFDHVAGSVIDGRFWQMWQVVAGSACAAFRAVGPCYESQPKTEQSCFMRTKWDKEVWGVVADVEACNPSGSRWVGCVFCPFYPVMYHGAHGWRWVSIPPGPLGWGWVVAWRAVGANVLCVAFYIQVWGGCTVLHAGLGRGWVWRWSVLHRKGRFDLIALGDAELGGAEYVFEWLIRAWWEVSMQHMVCKGWSQVSFFGGRGLDGSVFVGVELEHAWILRADMRGFVSKTFKPFGA